MRAPISALPVVLLAALFVVPGASAGQATSEAAWDPVDPAECVVEPMPPEEQRRLLEAGLATEMARAATPAPESPAATPPPGEGEPVDAVTLAAITASARLFTACGNAGDLPAWLALMTDETAAIYLTNVAVHPPGSGGTPVDPASLRPADLDAALARIAVARPGRGDTLSALVEVRDARLLPDGRIRATVVWISGLTAPETYEGRADFCLEDGRFLWHIAPPRRCGGIVPATPEA